MDNIMQIISMLKNNPNPNQAMTQMLGNDPLFQRAMQMCQNKSPDQIRQIALNLSQQRGIDLDELRHRIGF